LAGEKNFENRLKRWLESQGVWHVKFFANRNTRAGVPDILACINGRFVGIELKGPNGKPSPLQVYHCGKITESGGIAVIVWPDDFAQFKRLVQRLKEKGGNCDVQDLIFEGRYLHPVPA
jgi:hypothetical protein